MLALQTLEGAESEPALDCYLAVLEDALRVELLPLLERLRGAGLRCESDLRGRSLKAMMRHAVDAGRPLRGDRGRARVRGRCRRRCATWTSGEQREVPLGELVEELSG